MNSTPRGVTAMLTVGLGLLFGCAESPRSSAPPPHPSAGSATLKLRYVRETPPPPVHTRIVEKGGLVPLGRVVLVNAPLPAPRHEVPPPPVRGAQQVWLEGHWRYYDGHYVWVAGHWELPPRPRARYVPPRWDQRGEEHWFFEGYWQIF